MADISVYTLPTSPFRFDAVGIFYVCLAVIWTLLVLSGMVFLWMNRRLPIVKIRGLPLSFSAIVLLHTYWIIAQLAYPLSTRIQAVVACDIVYFIMGTYFPLGIALFHASNLRFLHVAKMQRQFITTTTQPEITKQQRRKSSPPCNSRVKSWLCRLRSMDYTKRVLIFVGCGMLVQVIVTVAMWFACRKYHPTFGIVGTELHGDTIEEQLANLSRGWEWWPSVLWQFIWTWIVAPFMIWRAWDIRDTMGWRVQTIGCCISNLHATPMFLIASYSPAFSKINVYFSPSQWIEVSIMMFEVFTIFLPVVQVIRLRILNRKVADSHAKWETASQASRNTVTSSIFSSKQYGGRASDVMAINSSSSNGDNNNNNNDVDKPDRLLTMSALDHVLRESPGPLQNFSALKDFSGENIAFLTSVQAWKETCFPKGATDSQKSDAFNRALRIYIDFISPRDAEFPLNVSSADLKRLENIFEGPARIVCGEASVDPATPFDTEPCFGQHRPFTPPSPTMSTSSQVTLNPSAAYEEHGNNHHHHHHHHHHHREHIKPPPSSSSSSGGGGWIELNNKKHDPSSPTSSNTIAGLVRYTGPTPPAFDPSVFDAVQSHIKYLVLTNTWPKFISEMQSQQRRRSAETMRSEVSAADTRSSGRTLASRVSEFVHSVSEKGRSLM